MATRKKWKDRSALRRAIQATIGSDAFSSTDIVGKLKNSYPEATIRRTIGNMVQKKQLKSNGEVGNTKYTVGEVYAAVETRKSGKKIKKSASRPKKTAPKKSTRKKTTTHRRTTPYIARVRAIDVTKGPSSFEMLNPPGESLTTIQIRLERGDPRIQEVASIFAR